MTTHEYLQRRQKIQELRDKVREVEQQSASLPEGTLLEVREIFEIRKRTLNGMAAELEQALWDGCFPNDTP